MKRKTFIMQGRRATAAACTLMMAAAALTTSCKDDVLTGQPEWLGNSIYERLQDEGTYTTVLRLIDDLEDEYKMRSVLAHTGSRTLFVADDAAYEKWFASNDWGVKSYDQLSRAQKKLLLKNAMINNAYLIELMSNGKAKGDNGTPEVGAAMRRETSVSIYDSVYTMQPSEFPDTKAWAKRRAVGTPIIILRDETAPPIIHFLPAFMRANSITDEDLAILTNQQAHSTAEAWVSGKRVVERDITCKNGYIQKVDGVVESSPNMAQIIHQHPNMSQWSHLLDRFSAPFADVDKNGLGEYSSEYNRLYNKDPQHMDTVYILRYFSDRWAGNGSLTKDEEGNAAAGKLKFDPGWNQYIDERDNVDLHNDAGVMIVPTDAAVDHFWNNEGHELKDEYKEWDNVTTDIIETLIRVHQQGTFTAAVPSKFGNVLNDALEPLGIKKEDVDSCFVGCNGVVYMTNKVFMPAEFQSVLYPALAHTASMNIIYWALTGAKLAKDFPFNYKPYLLSMNSKYALILPTNYAMQHYIDPYSYWGEESSVSEQGDSLTQTLVQAVEWEYDLSKSQDQYVQGKRYNARVESDGSLTDVSRTKTTVETSNLRNMLDNLVNQFIIVIPDSTKQKTINDYVGEGYNLFLTKSGSCVRVTRNSSGGLAFEGGWQMQGHGGPIEVAEQYNKVNGTSYQFENGLPLPTNVSLAATLQKHAEFEAFFKLANNDLVGLFSSSKAAGKDGTFTAGGKKEGNVNMKLFDNYNYTVYVPGSDVIRQMQADGELPTEDILNIDYTKTDKVDSLLRAEGWYGPENLKITQRDSLRNKVKTAIQGVVVDFIRYHVQDHSVGIGLASDRNVGLFETMKRNPVNNRFYALNVSFDTQQVTVTDEVGNVRHVVTTPGLYNNIVREYWFRGLEQRMVSDAIVHLIDGPLHYQKSKPWRQVVTETLMAWPTYTK